MHTLTPAHIISMRPSCNIPPCRALDRPRPLATAPLRLAVRVHFEVHSATVRLHPVKLLPIRLLLRWSAPHNPPPLA
jgi:hypothetical protein